MSSSGSPSTITFSTGNGHSRTKARLLLAVGPAVVFAVAWASTEVRSTMAIANVALVMAVVTVAVAAASWSAGLVTSAVAAVALNYFHTEPVHSLRITESSDVLSVLLLASIGIAVSVATALRVRAFAHQHVEEAVTEGRTLLATAGQRGRPVDVVWRDVVRTACAGLTLVDCRIEALGASPRLAAIARQRPAVDGPNTFVLPQSGAVIAFDDPRLAAQVVLTPREGMGSLEVDRRVVMAFMHQLELVLAGEYNARGEGDPNAA